MFTGIVETISTVKEITPMGDCLQLTIMRPDIFCDLNIGDSVSVNGVCLTITSIDTLTFEVMVVPETLRLTNLKHLKNESLANLERAMSLNNRFGGHYVQGHVDGTGKILSIKPDGDKALMMQIGASASLLKYIVKKGFIALDGMSMTVVDVSHDQFSVTIIPHTQQVTIARHYQTGTWVNIEIDTFVKYIEKLMGSYHGIH